jgi:NodT family efflux transporter outer membrane factor (OMF) lipoprotein
VGAITGSRSSLGAKQQRRKPLSGCPPLLGGILVAALTACAVGPNYPPSRPTLANFHNAPVGSTTAGESTRLDKWWLAFNDPSLTRIVQRALDQNLDLAASLARVTQARAAASAAGANFLPTAELNAQAAAMRQSLDSPIGEIAKSFLGYSRDQRLYDVGAQASWEIDLFGGLRRTAQAARAEAQAAEAERLGTRISVSAESADAYLQVRGDQARLTVAEKQVDVDSRLLDLVRVRRARGIASDREVAQAEALLQQARTTIPMLRVDLEAQLNRLDVLMGAQPGTYAKELATAADVPAIPAIPSDDRPLEVLRRRPDVIAAERQVAAANARIGVAISDYYPKISLSGVLGFESLAGSNLFSARAFQPVGTGALRWRLFDFGQVSAEVAAARGANAEALARYRQSVLRAAEDVEDAFVTLVQTELRTRELQDEVASLTRARDLSQQSYVAGIIPLTDVLDSDRQLLVARDDLAHTQADTARAAVRTFRALGGGWSSESLAYLSDYQR